MSIDTIQILTPILIVAIVALIVVRLTFSTAARVGDALVTPIVFVVIGALIGISSGMIWLVDQDGRVTIDKGVLLVVCGAPLGLLAGVIAQRVYSRLHRSKATAFVLVVMLLSGSIGASLGWIMGGGSAGSAAGYETADEYKHDLEQWSTSGMMDGVLIGSGIGFLLGLSEVLLHRRRATGCHSL